MSSLFYVRLSPHRADFPQDLAEDEARAMRDHAAFLRQQLEAGTLVVAGPVASPAGVFGVGIFETESREALDALLATDPATAVGTYEIAPMLSAVARARS